MTPFVVSTPERTPIAAATQAAIHSAIGRIPGTALPDTNFAKWFRDGLTTEFSIHFQGWSPTLHMAQVKIDMDNPPHDRDDPALAPWVLRRIAPVIAVQRRRARAGLAHGIATPLTCSPPFHGPTEMRHLQVDASLPRLAADNGFRDLHRGLTEAVRVLLDSGDSTGGGPLVEGDREFLMETGPDLSVRTVGVEISLHVGSGMEVTYDGRRLLLHGCELPETTLASAIGRPLGDLVRVHPVFDLRTIDGARQRHMIDTRRYGVKHSRPVVEVTLKPEWIRWVDVPGFPV